MKGKWKRNVAIGEPLERLVVQLRDLVEPLSELQARVVTGIARAVGTEQDTQRPRESAEMTIGMKHE